MIGLVTPLALAAVGERRDDTEPSTAVETREPQPATSALAGLDLREVVPARAAARDLRTVAQDSAVAIGKLVEAEQAEARAKRRAAARAAAKQKKDEDPAPEAASTGDGGPMTLRIGSFNVLGSQHTGPGGPRSNFASASQRTPQAVGLMREHDLDIVGMQEMQADQTRGIQGATGMSAYPGFGWGEAETDNSILYDPGVVELVSGSRFTVTFMGRPRPQPIARFRHLASGQEFYVLNTHPSAGGGAYAAQRSNAQGTLVGVVNRLKGEGLPVFVTGDMNDRQAFYCSVVPPTGMTAPNGGSYGSGCQPPPSPLPVDWVVGHGATWSNYWRDTRPVDRRISDHFLISATAHVG